MGKVFAFILLAIVVVLAAFALYLLIRILRIYFKARRLETMRGYETILYAAAPKLGAEATLNTLLPEHDPKALEEVLLRMGDAGEGEWKSRVVEMYRLAGFSAARTSQLRSRLKSRRSDAARRLGRIGDPASVNELAELLRDPREEVREAALFALGRMGTREALESMLCTLDKGDRWSQEKVAQAVEEAGVESRQVLIGLLEDENPRRRAFAAEVMGGIGGEEEAARLVEKLGDVEADVRARAAASLGRMRHRPARPGLLRALDDPAWEVRAQAVRALGAIGEEEDAACMAKSLRDSEWWVRNSAASALREMGEAGEGPLIRMLWDDDRFAREAAAQALEESSMVERLVKDLREGERGAQARRIIRRLAEIGSVGTIIQALSDMPDGEEKTMLAGLLSDLGHPGLDAALAGAGEGLAGLDPRGREGAVSGEEVKKAGPATHGKRGN